jgi:hypothetical protein
MNRVSLDNIGHAGFSHAFNSLSNPSSPSSIQVALDSFSTTKPSLSAIVAFVLARAFPIMLKAPTNWGGVLKKFNETTKEIGEKLLARTRNEGNNIEEKSIIGLLSEGTPAWRLSWPDLKTTVKAESAKTGLHMTQEEITAQVQSTTVPILCYTQ